MNYDFRLKLLRAVTDPTPDDFTTAVALLDDLDEYVAELREKIYDLQNELDEARHDRP